MPRNGVTIYDLLISCPSDVEAEIKIIKEAVESFNNLFGEVNNIRIETKHWSKNSFPQSGGKAQKLLNEQFVLDCDAAVAVFWTRFGTATEKYQSGTEEEIEELIKSGKQVFLYFSDRPVNPSNIDEDQYSRVKKFRKRYENEGLYSGFDSSEDFKAKILNHLTLYFLGQISNNTVTSAEQVKPQLLVEGISADAIIGTSLKIRERTKIDNSLVSSIKKDIMEKIEGVKQSSVKGKRFETEIQDKEELALETKDGYMELKGLSEKLGKVDFTSLLGTTKEVIIDEDTKKIINDFIEANDLCLNDDFFEVGRLVKQKSLYSIHIFNSGPSWSLLGSDEEKEKYNLIIEIADQIEEVNDLINFISSLEKENLSKLVISNRGTTFDEDIDVILKVPKGFMYLKESISIPSFRIMKYINQNSVENFYKPQASVEIESYSDYPTPIKSDYIRPIYPLTQSEYDKNNEQVEKYKDKIKELFCYEEYQNNDYDIITFNISYLKQNKHMFFPTYLVFKEIPDRILYEIKSKHTPHICCGEIKINS